MVMKNAMYFPDEEKRFYGKLSYLIDKNYPSQEK